MNKIEAPLDRILQDGSKFSDQPVERPVGGSTETGSLGTNAQWQNLRRIQPGNRAPGEAKGGIIDHDKQDDHIGCPARLEEHEVRDCRQGDDHGDGSGEEDLASTKSIHEIPRRNRGKQVCNGVDTSHENGSAANPPGFLEHERSVVGNDVDAVELSESLGRHSNEHAAGVALEHVPVRTLPFLAL